MIRVPQVRVLDEEGQQLGIMPTPQALSMAQERGLDLVEVAPTAAPPVVKFLDFGQYRYELAKREKEAKRKSRAIEFKEVRLTPKIGVGDFETKVHRAIEFLEDGDRIKVTVRFRGRELTHPEIGRTLLARFSDRVKDHGTVDRTPALEGKSMFMTLASVHKPRVHEHKIAGSRPDGTHEGPARGHDTAGNRAHRGAHAHGRTGGRGGARSTDRTRARTGPRGRGGARRTDRSQARTDARTRSGGRGGASRRVRPACPR